jgi:hypothetical protein
MQERRAWTSDIDCRLLSLRATGASWDSIAQDLRLGRYTVVERGLSISVE